MSLADTANGPDWILWVGTSIFFVIAVVLISGRGSGLIAGYNDLSKKEKEKYNEQKLCKVVGCGVGAIAFLLLFVSIFEKRLPASFSYVLLIFAIVDVAVMIILCNTICKK